MKIYKWLIGLATAIFFTLIVAWLSSLFFHMDAGWYYSLNKIAFAPSAFIIELCVTISYVLTAIVLAKLIVHKIIGLSFSLILFNGLLSILFVMSFFHLKQIYLSTTIVSIMFASSVAVVVRGFTKDRLCGIIYTPVAVWHGYAFIIMFVIALNN